MIGFRSWRSCTGTLGLVYLELELLVDEARNTCITRWPARRCERRSSNKSACQA